MAKAIETRYKGYRFRSRLEARWAVFLDSFHEEWQYEVEGFDLPSGRYLPDFWLPKFDCWLEIKPTDPTQEERKLCEELCQSTDKPVGIAYKLPQGNDEDWLSVYCVDTSDSGGGYGWWDLCFWAVDKQGSLCICSGIGDKDRCFFKSEHYDTFDKMKLFGEISRPITRKEANVAKAARFEFGESG